jgi:hypothetical protein
MPYKHNEKNRDNIRYKVTNWPEYNNALRKRGDFTVYFTEEAITEWHPPKTGSRGSPQKYLALAISQLNDSSGIPPAASVNTRLYEFADHGFRHRYHPP